jgi:hypothetical protein
VTNNAKVSIQRNVCLDSAIDEYELLGAGCHAYSILAGKDASVYLTCLHSELEINDKKETGGFRYTKFPPMRANRNLYLKDECNRTK